MLSSFFFTKVILDLLAQNQDNKSSIGLIVYLHIDPNVKIDKESHLLIKSTVVEWSNSKNILSIRNPAYKGEKT